MSDPAVTMEVKSMQLEEALDQTIQAQGWTDVATRWLGEGLENGGDLTAAKAWIKASYAKCHWKQASAAEAVVCGG